MITKKRVKKMIGELLLDMGVIDRTQLNEALSRQKQTGKLIGETLVELGFAREEDIVGAISFQYRIPYLRVKNHEVDKELLSLIPGEFASAHCFIPLDRVENVITIAIANPLDEKAIEEIGRMTKSEVLCFVSTPSEIAEAIEGNYGGAKKVKPVAESSEAEAPIKVFNLASNNNSKE